MRPPGLRPPRSRDRDLRGLAHPGDPRARPGAESGRRALLLRGRPPVHIGPHPHGHRLEQGDEGPAGALLDHAGQARARPARLRHARAPHRGPGRARARHLGQEGDRGLRCGQLHREVQGVLARLPGHHDRGVQGAGRLARLGPPLPHHRRRLHRGRLVDDPAGRREGPALPGQPRRAALVPPLRDRAGASRAGVPGPHRPIHLRQAPAHRRRRIAGHLDHDPLDDPGQQRRGRPPGAQLRARAGHQARRLHRGDHRRGLGRRCRGGCGQVHRDPRGRPPQGRGDGGLGLRAPVRRRGPLPPRAPVRERVHGAARRPRGRRPHGPGPHRHRPRRGGLQDRPGLRRGPVLPRRV